MKKLYLDCDGVILDTITKSYSILNERGIFSDEERRNFYREVDWDVLINVSGEIDNAISKIKILKDYFDIKILTHVNSEKEAISKIKYFSSVLPEIEVIIVPKQIEKANMINPTGNILVDDYSPNLAMWEEKGGISVKFSNSGRKYDFITIKDLLELIDINFEEKSKVKTK